MLFITDLHFCSSDQNKVVFPVFLTPVTALGVFNDKFRHKHAHTQPFCGPFSRTTQVIRCQKKSSSGLSWCKGR